MKLLKCLFVGIFIQMVAMKSEGQITYHQMVDSAYNQYENKKYRESAITYDLAFEKYPGAVTSIDLYNAACSWSLAHLADSAFYELNLYLNKGRINFEHLIGDSDLDFLHKDQRWEPFVSSCRAMWKSKLDLPLKTTLETILVDDQKYRKLIDTTIKKFGQNSNEFRDLIKKVRKTDSANLVKVSDILDEKGWPSYESVGGKAITSLFLVIQHSDLKTQEKYLALMKEAAKQDNLAPADLALLEDRIAIRKGQKQIYGSQVEYDQNTKKYIVLPIADEKNVNKRRTEVGLEPLESYLKNYEINYTPLH